MLDIAGAAYYEHCASPPWDYLYGSGVRAAAAVSGLSTDICLHTYVDERNQEQLKLVTDSFGFQGKFKPTEQTVRFNYVHGLSVPTTHPARYEIKKNASLRIEAGTILRFGFLEGDAIVSGERVVYDPQSPETPSHFSANGSKAAHLSIVANYREACILSGENKTAAISRILFEKEGAEVVIIKQGCLGSYVATVDHEKLVPAFKTPKVWPIGSGDVYAAIYAHYWGLLNLDPFKAAGLASQATAYYCANQTLPIPKDFSSNEVFNFEPIKPGLEYDERSNQVYLAGPFFTMAQLWAIEQARESLLGQGLEVFSPLHDIGRGTSAEVVSADLEGLLKSRAVFALIDGLDAGTMFEVGYARALDIPVIAFVQAEQEEDLKMLDGTGCRIFTDFVTAVYHTAWKVIES